MFLWNPNTHKKFWNTLNLRNLLALPSAMNVTQFRRSIYQCPGLLKHIFQKEEQDEKDRLENERLKRIEKKILLKNCVKKNF